MIELMELQIETEFWFIFAFIIVDIFAIVGASLNSKPS